MADRFPRVQEVLLPILREAIPEAQVGSWTADIDYREYPVINVRRIGGERSRVRPDLIDYPVIELTAYGGEGLPETEVLYTRALDALYEAAREQRVTEFGHVISVSEPMGMTQFSSLFQDSYRVQGLIKIGIRRSRKDV